MATTTIPVPRSYSQIVGQMTNALLSQLGLPVLQVGNPALSVIEAAAQSDLRSSADLFNLLASGNLDTAAGLALDNLGANVNTPRIAQVPSSGTLSITDSSFSKVASTIFPGQPAPIIGSSIVYITNATGFPFGGGAIYIGRGTTNYEGPLVYTSITSFVNYFAINLAGGNYTQNYHNLNESVILAQGGNRLISAGTVAQTPQGNVSTALQFSTLYNATIPDGETNVSHLPAQCTVAGSVGNIPANVVSSFVTAPFVGATVTNDAPFSNGLDNEPDNTYRERIRDVQQSFSRGTPLALTTAVIGTTATDENKIVLSASVVTRDNEPTTLYIDDGTGYEPIYQGVPYEVIVDFALGGEQYFQLVQGRPVQKAQDVTLLSAPYNMRVSRLAVIVGGQLSTHDFSASDFRSISSASAFEVAASINADPNTLFQANPTNNGTQVSITAKQDTNESISVVPPGPGFVDANQFLAFPAGTVDTLRLYKNDILLSKDGAPAEVVTNPQSLWAPMSSPQTLAISVDGIQIVDGVTPGYITFTDADFVNAKTGFSTLAATNSLASWAAVFNYRIPGITATVTTGAITFQSNRGNSASAQVGIQGGTLATPGNLFGNGATPLPILSVGVNNDYTLDRNLGQIRLNDNEILAVGDRLTAGSQWTRAFLSSPDLGTLAINSVATSVSGQNGAELWFVVDGDANIISTPIGPAAALTWSVGASPSWGVRVRITSTASHNFFNVAPNVVLPGDWVVINDLGVTDQINRGAWRVANVDTTSGYWIEIEQVSGWSTTGAYTLLSGGFVIVRTPAEVQRVFIATAATYTATSLVAAIETNSVTSEPQLLGATAVVYQTQQIRIRTDDFQVLQPGGGDIALVLVNSEGAKLGFPVSSAVPNQTSHLASILAQNTYDGTPNFLQEPTISTVTSTSEFVLATGLSLGPQSSGLVLVGLVPLPDSGPLGRESNVGHITPINVLASSNTDVTVEYLPVNYWLPGDRFYAANPYAIGPLDQLTIVVDGNTASERYVQNMYRDCGTEGTTYSSTITLNDADAANQSLAVNFGVNMNWVDFALFMPGRVKDNNTSGDTTSTMLWRYTRLGPDGNNARIQYGYPNLPSSAIGINTVATADQYTDITVTLATGSAITTNVTLRNTTNVGFAVIAGPSSGLYSYLYVFDLAVASISRVLYLNTSGNNGTLAGTGTVTSLTNSGHATATVISATATTATIHLTSAITGGTILAGDSLTFSAGFTGATTGLASGAPYGYTTVTLTAPAGSGITSLGTVPSTFWLTSSSGSFGTGAYTVAATTGLTLSYIDNIATVASAGAIGTVAFDNSGDANINGSAVTTGNLMSVFGGAFPAAFQDTLQLTAVDAAGGWVTGNLPAAGPGVSTTLTWALSGAQVSFFPLNAGVNTIVAIAAAVNALTNVPVTAVALGVGGVNTGVITGATYESGYLGGTNPWWYLSDGINYVQSTNTPANTTVDFIFTLKNQVTASLATNSDWADETVKLVPITALNVVDYLNTPGPGGLFSVADIEVANRARAPQIATNTLGSVGSVVCQGGSANFVSSSIVGSAIDVASTYMVVNCSYADSLGFYAGNAVRLQNTKTVPKANIMSTTELTSIVVGAFAVVTYNSGGAPAWTFSNSGAAPITGLTWLIEQQGNFTAFTYFSGGAPTLTGVNEGDWVVIASNISSGNVVSANQGIYRIVRIDATNYVFWIENPNSQAQLAVVDLAFLTYDSTMPGDILTVGTNFWDGPGGSNQGTWTVNSIDLSVVPTGTPANAGSGNTGFIYALDVITGVGPFAVGTPPGALGSLASLVSMNEGTPSRLYKFIMGVNQSQSNPTLADVKFTTDAGYTKVSATAGTLMTVLDKLAFPTATATGIDGYQHNTGLIAAANNVAYGVESDPTTYPGIVAAGANVNISGPVVLGVQVSLAIRTQSGVNLTDITDQVQSAVAAVINQTPVGVSVAISALVDAASSVNGVVAVSVLSPAYGPGNDLIAVQAFEKPYVLNLATDILVSFVGT